MPVPPRVNPDSLLNEDSLYELDKLRRFSICMQNIPSKQKQASDAIKVIDCLRFITVNEKYLRYAFNHQEERDVYLSDRDKSIKTLRDFNNTAIDLKDVNTGQGFYNSDDQFLSDLKNTIIQFEHAIEVVTQKNKLKEFIDKLLYDEAVGCIGARITSALLYAKELETSDVPHFEEFMQKVAASFTEDTGENYRKVYQLFRPYLGQRFRYKKSEEIEISYANIDKYMSEILGQELLESKEEGPIVNPNNILPLIDTSKLLTRTAEDALNIIHKGDGLVKAIPVRDDSLFYMINNLLDPANYRPLKRISDSINRRRHWNPREGKWMQREIKASRGLPKEPDWQWTKKTATTLLPTNGKIILATSGIAFLFDLKQCNLKNQKYIWKHNAQTDSKWWLSKDTEWLLSPNGVSIDELKNWLQDFVNKNQVPHHNEILACLSRQALHGVFAMKDETQNRLQALRAKIFVKEILNVDVPLLIITPQTGVKPCNDDVLLDDFNFALNNPASTEYQILLSISRQPHKFIQEFSSSIREMISKLLVVHENISRDELIEKVLKLFHLTNFDASLFQAGIDLLQSHPHLINEGNMQACLKQGLLNAMQYNKIHFVKKFLVMGANYKGIELDMALAAKNEYQVDLLETILNNSKSIFTEDQIFMALKTFIENKKNNVALQLWNKYHKKLSIYKEDILILSIKHNLNELILKISSEEENKNYCESVKSNLKKYLEYNSPSESKGYRLNSRINLAKNLLSIFNGNNVKLAQDEINALENNDDLMRLFNQGMPHK